MNYTPLTPAVLYAFAMEAQKNPRAARFAAVLMSMVLAVGLGGCSARSSESYETPDPSVKVTDPGWGQSDSTSPSPSPSPSVVSSYPPPPEGESEEKAAIRKGWENYRTVADKLAKDPNLTDLAEASLVTTGEESAALPQAINELRGKNLLLAGDTIFRNVTVGDPETNADGVRVAVVTSCLDPTHQYTIDSTTGERSEDTRTKTLWETTTMEKLPDGS